MGRKSSSSASPTKRRQLKEDTTLKVEMADMYDSAECLSDNPRVPVNAHSQSTKKKAAKSRKTDKHIISLSAPIVVNSVDSESNMFSDSSIGSVGSILDDDNVIIVEKKPSQNKKKRKSIKDGHSSLPNTPSKVPKEENSFCEDPSEMIR